MALSTNLWQFADNWIVWAILLLAFCSYFLLLEHLFRRRDAAWRASLGYWLKALPVMLSALPLLGLLGTIAGLLETFREMGRGGLDLQAMMSSGIADALVTTQLGLIMLIPGWLLLACLRHLYQATELHHAD